VIQRIDVSGDGVISRRFSIFRDFTRPCCRTIIYSLKFGQMPRAVQCRRLFRADGFVRDTTRVMQLSEEIYGDTARPRDVRSFADQRGVHLTSCIICSLRMTAMINACAKKEERVEIFSRAAL